MRGRFTDDSDTWISAAITQVEIEQSRLSDEQTAFERFRARIEEIAPDQAVPKERLIGYEQQTSARTLATVREAYAETVMSVPHYDEDYDDTYEQSIHAEFGPEIAVLLTQSNQFTPATKSTLLAGVDEAIDQRTEFKKVSQRELKSLRSAAAEVEPISNTLTSLSTTDFDSASFGALDAYLHQTDVLITDCDEIAKQRQQELAKIERSWQSAASSLDLTAYFYQSLPVTHPVLARLGDIGGTIESLRQDIKQAIIYRAG